MNHEELIAKTVVLLESAENAAVRLGDTLLVRRTVMGRSRTVSYDLTPEQVATLETRPELVESADLTSALGLGEGTVREPSWGRP